MAKFIVDTTDNNISKSMLEMILEEHLDYNVYIKEVKPVDEEGLNKLAKECADNNWDTVCSYNGIQFGFKRGYRKAMED